MACHEPNLECARFQASVGEGSRYTLTLLEPDLRCFHENETVRRSYVAELKTKPTRVSAESHIAAIASDEQRNDARTLVALMRRVTRHEPRMWGPSIVGFGSYHYKYPSGHEGDSALAAFAVRGRELVVYSAPEFKGRDALLARLGRHRTGKVCLYQAPGGR
jgi:hypothetical protein